MADFLLGAAGFLLATAFVSVVFVKGAGRSQGDRA